MKEFLEIAFDKASNLLLKATSDREKYNFDNVIDILKLLKHEKHYEHDKLDLSQEMFDKLISGSVNTENILEALETLHTNGSNGKNGKPEQKCGNWQKRAGIPISTKMLELLIEHSESAERLVSSIQMLDAVKFSPAMKNRIFDAIKLYPDNIIEIVHGVSLLADDDQVAIAYLSRLNPKNVKNAFSIAQKISELDMENQLTPDTIEVIFSESFKCFAPKNKGQPGTEDKTKMHSIVASSESVLNKTVPLFTKGEKLNAPTNLVDTLLNNSFFKEIKPAAPSAVTLINQNESESYLLD